MPMCIQCTDTVIWISCSELKIPETMPYLAVEGMLSVVTVVYMHHYRGWAWRSEPLGTDWTGDREADDLDGDKLHTNCMTL